MERRSNSSLTRKNQQNISFPTQLLLRRKRPKKAVRKEYRRKSAIADES
jgi:hypothetical protein